MKKQVQKLRINSYSDREKIIAALANSGYKVWVEEYTGDGLLGSNTFFVCYEDKP